MKCSYRGCSVIVPRLSWLWLCLCCICSLCSHQLSRSRRRSPVHDDVLIDLVGHSGMTPFHSSPHRTELLFHPTILLPMILYLLSSISPSTKSQTGKQRQGSNRLFSQRRYRAIRKVCGWTSTTNRQVPEVQTKWVELQRNGEHAFISYEKLLQWLIGIFRDGMKMKLNWRRSRPGYWGSSEPVSKCTIRHVLDGFAHDAPQPARKEGYIKIATRLKYIADSCTLLMACIIVASTDADYNDKLGWSPSLPFLMPSIKGPILLPVGQPSIQTIKVSSAMFQRRLKLKSSLRLWQM